jgi:hypothetical protein
MKALFLFFLSAMLSNAWGATCSTVNWTNPGDMTGVTLYKILHGADQATLAEKCQVLTVPSTSVSCAGCGDLGSQTTGIVGVQTCNGPTTCAPVEVGALPADPPPTQPASAQGVTASP